MKFISFDLDGTLVTTDFHLAVWDEVLPYFYALKNNLPLEQAAKKMRNTYEEVGEGKLEWYDIKYWLHRFGLKITWQDIFERAKNKLKYYNDVLEVLEGLCHHHHLILSTNATREFVETELDVLKLNNFFREVFSATSDFGLVKKSSQFYLLVCSRLKVAPQEITHIGDHPEFDFEVPRSIGMRAYLLDRSGKMKGEFIVSNLKEFREKVDLE